MKTVNFIFIFLLGMAANPAFSAECTPKAGEPGLTLAQAMYHWGRATRIVGMIAMNGMQNPSSITAQRLQENKTLIEVAQECARLVVTNENDLNLLPSKAKNLVGPEREAYVERFKESAALFSAGLDVLYQNLCEALLSPTTPTVYEKLRDQVQLLLQLATDAHGRL